MPSLDLSVVLNSPEFLDTISVVSTTVDGSSGVPIVTPSAPTVIPAIVIPNPERLMRKDDGSRRDGVIEIYSKAQLSAGAKASDSLSTQADIVTWHTRQYTVIEPSDFGAFAAGFWRVVAELLPLNPTNPS